MSDDRRFRLLFKALPRARQKEVSRLALLSRRASDPETAWLVSQFARRQLRVRWLAVVFTVIITVQVAWVVHDEGWSPSLLWMIPALGLWIAYDLLLLGCRRAIRLNDAIAREPG